MKDLSKEIIAAVRAHAEGHIAKHKSNIDVYLAHPVGVGEHPDIIEAIEQELEEMAKYADQIEILDNYF